MFEANEDYLKLPGSYLFSTVAKKAAAYQKAHPEAKIIRMGIGDVTQPLPPAVIKALHRAVDEMADAETFRGYAPDLGYDFLRKAMAENDYRARGCDIADDEIFISDGAKSDSGNIQEIFQRDNVLAVCDPVYPVYVDSNVMAGRTGTYDEKTTRWSNVIYMPCTEENGFAPDFPEKTPDFIYLCSPNNPTGTALTKDQLQGWVDYANRNGAVIIRSPRTRALPAFASAQRSSRRIWWTTTKPRSGTSGQGVMAQSTTARLTSCREQARPATRKRESRRSGTWSADTCTTLPSSAGASSTWALQPTAA